MKNKDLPREFYFLMIIEITYMLGRMIIQPIFPLYLRDLGISISELSIIMSIPAIMALFMSIPLGIISDKLKKGPILVYGLLILFISNLSYSYVTHSQWIYLIRIFEAIAIISYTPVSHAFVADIIPKRKRAESFGIFLTSVGLASLLGPLISSTLINTLNQNQLFRIAALPPILGVMFYLLWYKPDRENIAPSRTIKKEKSNLFNRIRAQSWILAFLSFYEFDQQNF